MQITDEALHAQHCQEENRKRLHLIPTAPIIELPESTQQSAVNSPPKAESNPLHSNDINEVQAQNHADPTPIQAQNHAEATQNQHPAQKMDQTHQTTFPLSLALFNPTPSQLNPAHTKHNNNNSSELCPSNDVVNRPPCPISSSPTLNHGAPSLLATHSPRRTTPIFQAIISPKPHKSRPKKNLAEFFADLESDSEAKHFATDSEIQRREKKKVVKRGKSIHRKKKGKEAEQQISQTPAPSSDLSDSNINVCNQIALSRNFEWEASQMWKLGEKVGVVGKGNDREIILKLLEMEERDKAQRP